MVPRSTTSAMLIVIIAAIVAYGQIIKFELGRFDEDGMIRGNIKILKDSATISDVVQQDPFFRKPGLNFYRPAQNISLWMDVKLGKGKASTFHWTNLLLHVLTCVVVLRLLNVVTTDKLTSTLLAVVFAVNPLFAQAIAWVPGRGDLIVGLCSAAFLHAILRDPEISRTRTVITTLAATAIAIFAKETSILFPAILVLFVLARGSRGTLLSRNFLIVLLGSAASAGLYLWARSVVVTKTTQGNQFGLEPLLYNLRVIPEVVAKFVLPIGLQPMASYSILPTVVGICVIGALGYLIWRITDTESRMLAVLGAVWFVAFMLPGAMFIHADGVAAYDYLEHRAYLPIIGLLIPAALVFSTNSNRLAWGTVHKILGVLCIGYLVVTLIHVQNYATPLSFYDKAVSANPTSSLAHTNRGLLRENRGDIAGALEDYTDAIEANPAFAQAYVNRGNRYGAAGDKERAKDDYIKAIQHKPWLFPARYNLGNYYLDTRQLDKAYEQYKAAADLNPTFTQTHALLGVTASLMGNNLAAETHLNEALRLNPGNAQNLVTRGRIRFAMQNYQGARSDWQQSSALGNAEASTLLNQIPQ